MRPYEIAFLLTLIPGLLGLSLRAGRSASPIRKWLLVAAFPAAILAALQVAVEGYRWQMIPAYALACVLAPVAILELLRAARLARGWSLVGWGLLGAAVAAGLAFPMFQFPKPTGPYSVGTEALRLVDWNRRETLGGEPGRPREVMVQVWYPAQAQPGAQPARYISDPRLIKAFRDSHLALVPTHSYLKAPAALAAGPFPVVIFSPSWQGQRSQNTFQVEELASHGFVVIGIDHPYSTAITLFPDGRIARAAPMEFRDLSSDESLRRSFEVNEYLIQIRAQDIEFVASQLNHLGSPGRPNQLDGHLDAERLGVFGYSFGGGAAAEACAMDKRFKAGIDMDGALFGPVATTGIEQPFLFLDDGNDPPWADLKSANPVRRRYARTEERDLLVERQTLQRRGGYRVKILGTEHINFTDTALFSPVRRITGAGKIGARRAMEIINAYSVAFFEEYLKGNESALLHGPSPQFPEVRFQHLTAPNPVAGNRGEPSEPSAQ